MTKDERIAELRQENEQLKKELAEYKEVLETYKKKPVNIYQVEIRNLQVDKAELKLEIEKLQDKLKRTEKAMHEEVKEHLEYYNADQKHLRHEICEKIRNKAFATETFCDDKSEIVKYTIYVDDLDQIERGEE